MIDNDRLEDLARMYRLFFRVAAGPGCLRKSLRETIIRRGKDINEAGATTGGDGGDSQDEDMAEPSAKAKGKAKARPPPTAASQTLALALKWVQDVLDLKDKFDKIWSKAFHSDRDLESSINEVGDRILRIRSWLTKLHLGVRDIHQPEREGSRVHLAVHRREPEERSQRGAARHQFAWI